MIVSKTPPKHISEAFDALFNSAPVGVSGSERQAEGPCLANRGATFHPDEIQVTDDLKESPSARWRLKSTVVKLLKSQCQTGERSYSVCGCGHAGNYMADGELQTVDSVRLFRGVGERPSVTVGGTFKCQSPWLCPSCGPSRALKRKNRLQEVMEHTDAMGGTSAFVTLTIRHKIGMSLKEVKDMLSTASRKARQGKGWKNIQAMADVLGVVQGVEVLHNKRTGWHYHSHMLVPCLGDPVAVRAAMRKLVARYMREVRKLGGSAKKVGQDVQIVRDTDTDAARVSQYASKGSASWEIAGGLKSARERESRTPWDLAQLANAGDADAKALFLEYAENIVGTRSCVVSASLAKKLHLKPEANDDDQAVLVDDEEQAPVVEILTEKWRKLMSYGLAWRVIGAVEQGQDSAAVESVIRDLIHGVDCREAKARYDAKPKPAKVDVAVLAAAVVGKRQMGQSWAQAEKSAVSDLKRTMKIMGREVVLPDADELGRAVSREIEINW